MDPITYHLEGNEYIAQLEQRVGELSIELLRTQALLATIAPQAIEQASGQAELEDASPDT